MEKCTFCVHRVEKGMLPACVDTCPVQALRFGDISDPDTPISVYLRERDTFQLLEEVGTQPRVFYVGQQPSRDAREIETVAAGV